ncbi:RHS repeat domain-containing protein [Psychroserpens sp. SPM9]|uniref:RHS repeat domain-containing protein n=1 Tax=Psychroserpens sp. SPM9 TaxID=2975598 RepID=UPI0021A87BD2|nr:RHS repeat domain-containing protein [Psychroserpens sp. SPM9]MDG5490641.1 RHS repeat protein [Psychroserpens sp. SPM9]
MKNFVAPIMTVFAVMISIMSFGQELPEVIPPSPTVANLMQFEEVPVSYYTGQPNISIPIYSKGLTGDLSMGISLSYNTQGVQINNRSGWTGTSWSLMAGGTISRTVRGEPDEITKSTSTTNKTGIYHLNDYWSYNSLSGAQKTEFNFLVVGESGNKYDNKPDLYQFNFMGYSGRFVILKEGSNLVPKYISRTSNFEIDITHDSNYVISAFKVTDAKGYQYTFDVVETSTSTPFTGTKVQGNLSTFNVSAAASSYNANSAWHLSKIETSKGNDLATITYQNVIENYTASTSRTSNTIINFGAGYNDLVNNSYNKGILEPAESVSYQSISSTTKKINEITFTRDNIKVKFDLDLTYTHPETNGRTLKSITIKKGSTVNKTFNLNYEETSDTSLNPLVFKRVWLTKVTETAGGINQDYNLVYNNKQDLPGFNKDDVRGDSWGYYSGIDVGQTSCDNISYSESIVTTGLLKSIEYPTGGVKEFVFEHNSYSYYQDQLIGYDDYMQNPRNILVQTDSTNNFVYNHNGNSAPTVTIETFTLDFDQDIYVSSDVTANPSQYLSDHIIKIYNGSYEAYVDLDQNCVKVSNVPAGTYTMALAPYINLNANTYQISGDFEVVYSDQSQNVEQAMIGGGVRIKEILFKNAIDSQLNDKKIKFEYLDESNSSLSSGVVDAKADRLVRTYQKNTSRHVFGNIENICHSLLPQTIQYEVIEKGVNVELSQGSYVGYRHVKVYEENNGSTTYSYTSPYDYPSVTATFDFEQPKPKENLDYKRGLLLEQKTYNQSGDPLKEISYLDSNGDPNYEFQEDFLFTDRSVFRPNCNLLQYFTDWTFYNNGTIQNHPPAEGGGFCQVPNQAQQPCGAFPVIGTDFKSGWAKLKGTTTKEYFYNGGTTVKESRQEFLYNSLNYQISQQDTYYDKSGVEEHLQTKYFYPVGTNLNSNTTTIKNKLIALNKVNEVLETQTFRNGTKVSETHTIYHEFHTNVVLPKEVKVGKGTITPEKRIEFHKYDTYDNPLEVSKVDGAHISYIYGFNKSLPVAKVTNATYANIEVILGTNFTLADNLSAANETSLRNGLPDALISVYRYDPILGITSTVDEKGYEMTYEYDPFNRLKRVKDADGNILSENAYFYQNQY